MLSGIPVIYGIDPFSSSADPVHDLGSIGIAADGRRFRYAKAGGSALVAGTLVQAPAEDTGDQNIAATAAAIGAKQVVTASMTVTKNQYAGGLMIVTVTPGEGYAYRIKRHDAYTSAAATFELLDPIQVALTTGSRLDFLPSPYNGVVINPAAASSAPVGLAFNATPAGYYTWVQVGGPAAVLNDGGSTVGTNVSASNATAGAVEAAVTAQAAVGYALTGVATTEFGAIMLKLE